jgi:hypothetical protein
MVLTNLQDLICAHRLTVNAQPLTWDRYSVNSDVRSETPLKIWESYLTTDSFGMRNNFVSGIT